MLHPINKRVVCFLLLIAAAWLLSCNKATVNFGEESLTDDPNIIYLDTMTINMGTYQSDSFYTAGDTMFIAGIHTDSLLGNFEATAFMQPGIPASNPLSGCTNCTFDSLAFITRFAGGRYGDTTETFSLKVHRLNQRMIPDETSISYSTSYFNFDPDPLGAISLNNTRPSAHTNISVRLSDILGETLFSMLKRNSDTITNSDIFNKYFNGFALKGEGAHKQSVYYFTNQEPGNSVVMRLYYRQNGTTPVAGNVDFHLIPPSYQFNSFACDRSNTPLSVFTPKKKQVIDAALTGNKAFLHSNGGLFPHLNFPSLFTIKELHPYVKVIKAELEIAAPELNYGPGNYYMLPPALALYTMDDNNTLGSALSTADGTGTQGGNLFIDELYHKDTKYTYDLTAYVNSVLSAGRTAAQSLVLFPLDHSSENRLILNALPNNKSVKLKLYVLGL